MNDTASLIVSVFALALSLISTLVSVRLQMRSGRQSAHDQLGNITQRLIDLLGAKSELWNTNPDQRDMAFFSQEYALNYKLSLLARQADYLIAQESQVVSDVQYSLIAQGLAQIGDFQNAEKYWCSAVDNSSSPFYQIVNLRGFADFLFAQGQYDTAKRRFEEALKIWNSDTDFNKYTNGYTYQMWFVSHTQNLGMNAEGMAYYEQARQLFSGISNANMRANALRALEAARMAFMANPMMPSVQMPAAQPPENR